MWEYVSIPLEQVPAADWIPASFINMDWREFEETFGIVFVENSGGYEAPGPVAQAAIKFEDGEIFPFEHHFDRFESRVIVYAIRESDYAGRADALARRMEISPDLITDVSS